MRTYSRSDFEAARAAWSDFDGTWEFHRRLAADRGMLYPPSGTRWDDIDDPKPSQRAIVYRAMTDTPLALTEAIRASSSWSQVIHRLLLDIEHRREDASLAEKDAAWDRRQYRGPMEPIATIFGRLRDSMP